MLKTYVIDIDGTICTNTFGKYNEALPFKNRINFINNLYDQGNIIKYFTARGSTTEIDWSADTKKQFSDWGVKYHDLIFKKPEGDIFVDDKSFNSEIWFSEKGIKYELKNDLENNFDYIKEQLQRNKITIDKIIRDIKTQEMIIKIAESIVSSFNKNGKIIFAGNGGSFADSQHLSAEFVSKFSHNRIPLASITLGTNSSNLSAIGNDFGFENIFAREFEALAKKEDILIAISTSGNSKNIIRLVKKAEEMKVSFYILTGLDGGYLNQYEKNCLKIPSTSTAIIQQCHILIGHIIVGLSEKSFLKNLIN